MPSREAYHERWMAIAIVVESGVTIKGAADLFEVSEATVRNACEQFGVDISRKEPNVLINRLKGSGSANPTE